jgi:hypothetical protein
VNETTQSPVHLSIQVWRFLVTGALSAVVDLLDY